MWLSAWEEGQADSDAICSDDWLVFGCLVLRLVLWLTAACEFGWLAGREAVCLVGCRLVSKLSAWMDRLVVEL